MDRDEQKRLTKHYLAVLAARAPGYSVEVRVPPFGAVQAVEGGRHTRGTPRAVVETDPDTWIALAEGTLSWAHVIDSGKVHASGERTDLSAYLPLND
ncbi:MAG: sterol carrier family protein [Marmoricola sp.]